VFHNQEQEQEPSLTFIEICVMPSPDNSEPDAQAEPKKASLLQVARIVASGFVMIGRGRDYAPGAPTIDPIRLIVLALVAAALLIGALVLLVRVITA
jgi:hypothetical protein